MCRLCDKGLVSPLAQHPVTKSSVTAAVTQGFVTPQVTTTVTAGVTPVYVRMPDPDAVVTGVPLHCPGCRCSKWGSAAEKQAAYRERRRG